MPWRLRESAVMASVATEVSQREEDLAGIGHDSGIPGVAQSSGARRQFFERRIYECKRVGESRRWCTWSSDTRLQSRGYKPSRQLVQVRFGVYIEGHLVGGKLNRSLCQCALGCRKPARVECRGE